MSKCSVELNQAQRKMVEEIVRKGESPARKIMHAQHLAENR